MTIITLLTDFGIQDEYIGVLKGVILNLNPELNIVDLTHGIEAQNIVQAAHLLKSAYSYFPKGTIHVAVVDPGVGTQRSILAVSHRGHFFIAPDNGLLSGIWDNDHERKDAQPELIVRVENEQLFLHPISHTFHGRDIFAPVAAHISLGMDIQRFGVPVTINQVIRLSRFKASEYEGNLIKGQIITIDHFGNLITNISIQQINRLASKAGRGAVIVRIAGYIVQGISTCYAEAETGQVLALIGSRDVLEIAVNGASAAQRFNVSKGSDIFVTTGERSGNNQ